MYLYMAYLNKKSQGAWQSEIHTTAYNYKDWDNTNLCGGVLHDLKRDLNGDVDRHQN